MFSRRLPSDFTRNRLTENLERLRASGRRVIDLTLSNPTRAGFDYPAGLLDLLGDDAALVYEPHSLGRVEARSAVADDYRRRGTSIDVERIALTASTSEAYSILFKILCDPGDRVAIPQPSYPLFDHLTQLDAVVPVPYSLEYQGRWMIDQDTLERSLTPETRAVLVVTPNNPTGSFVTHGELDWLAAICAGRGIAIIADEVFVDYELEPGARKSAGDVLEDRGALTFSLGGLSKTVGLPQAKLAWIAVGGPEGLVAGAMQRLELACDTYLSVSTPVQLACPDLLTRGSRVREQIQTRVAANYAWLVDQVAHTPSCGVLNAEGGWSAVLQVPSFVSEDDLVNGLLEEGVLVHPGYFFDFSRESFLIVSLVVPVSEFQQGIARTLHRFATVPTQP